MIGRINCSKHSLRSKMCHRWEVCLLSKTCSLIAMQWVCQFTGHSLAFAKNIIILTAWLSCDKPQLNEKIYYHILHNAQEAKSNWKGVIVLYTSSSPCQDIYFQCIALDKR